MAHVQQRLQREQAGAADALLEVGAAPRTSPSSRRRAARRSRSRASAARPWPASRARCGGAGSRGGRRPPAPAKRLLQRARGSGRAASRRAARTGSVPDVSASLSKPRPSQSPTAFSLRWNTYEEQRRHHDERPRAWTSFGDRNMWLNAECSTTAATKPGHECDGRRAAHAARAARALGDREDRRRAAVHDRRAEAAHDPGAEPRVRRDAGSRGSRRPRSRCRRRSRGSRASTRKPTRCVRTSSADDHARLEQLPRRSARRSASTVAGRCRAGRSASAFDEVAQPRRRRRRPRRPRPRSTSCTQLVALEVAPARRGSPAPAAGRPARDDPAGHRRCAPAASHDLERDHPLAAGAPAVAEADRVADRQRHRRTSAGP